MITNSTVNARNFIYCTLYQGPNESFTYYNDNDGHYHAAIYMIEGTMELWASDTETPTDADKLATPEPGMFYDISHTRGKYVVSKTGSVGASLVMFNPVPADKKLNIEILKGSQTKELSADGRATIVCLTGPVDVNGKTLKSSQYAVSFDGKPATLTMGDNTLCAIVTE